MAGPAVPARFRVPAWLIGASRLLVGALLLVATTLGVVLLAAAGRVGPVVASEAEARFAAAVTGYRLGWPGADALPVPDAFAARQLAALEAAAGLGDLSALDAARVACLLLAAGTAVALWPVLRALDVTPFAAVSAIVIAGVGGALLVGEVGATGAYPAALWLVAAAAIGSAGSATRVRRVLAGLVAAVAVLTAPLLGAVLLAVAAHVVLDGTVRVAPRLRPAVGAVLAVGAALVGWPALTLLAAGDPRPAALLVLLLVGAVVLAVAAGTQPWTGPLLTGPAALLVAAVLPVPAQGAAMVLAVPALAVVAGLLLSATRVPRLVPAVAGGGAVVVGLAGVLLPAPAPMPQDLAGWVVAELPPGTPVRADSLDRAGLLAAGLPAALLRGPADAVGPGEAQLVAVRPGELDTRCPEPLAVTPYGSGGAPAVLCAPAPATDRAVPDTVTAGRIGEALAGNPALRLGPGVAELLRRGEVDERVMTVLAAITVARTATIADLPAVPLDTPDRPRRQLLITEIDGGPAADNPLVRTFLAAQQAPYVPSRVEPVGSALLLTWYAVPVPP